MDRLAATGQTESKAWNDWVNGTITQDQLVQTLNASLNETRDITADLRALTPPENWKEAHAAAVVAFEAWVDAGELAVTCAQTGDLDSEDCLAHDQAIEKAEAAQAAANAKVDEANREAGAE
ncbi:MAG TPA: hypothetical protein VNZ52_05110 [Candidatus Thermoplasmatota archaeon]|nr:hypothetical protein [Candidatus Thermoplasmatota archaeon]